MYMQGEYFMVNIENPHYYSDVETIYDVCSLQFNWLTRCQESEPAEDNELKLFFSNYLSAGDYNYNGTVGTSNIKYFAENLSQYEGILWWYLNEAFNSTSIIIDASVENATHCELTDCGEDCKFCGANEIREILDGLEDYPVIDESLLSEVEHDTTCDCWESYGQSDFTSALESRYEALTDKEIELDDAKETDITDLYYSLCNEAGQYPEIELNDAMFFETEIADHATAEDILNLLPAKQLELI